MGNLQIRNLSFSYPGEKQYALYDVNLVIEKGSFFLLCGLSGCGKSTLLRQLQPALAPAGIQQGEILWNGTDIYQMDFRQQCQTIGFVQQNPEYQITTDKVWHELAFGLENLGYDSSVIRRRVAEMASFFGIQTWFHRNTSELSGGQKQLLNLAAVMVMQPDILILDEPTSQLDPIAASEFLELLARVNREFGTTIILSEHRLEEAVPLASQMAVMDCGMILCSGTSDVVGHFLREKNHPVFLAMPSAMQIWAALEENVEKAVCPVTVREGKNWLQNFSENHIAQPIPREAARQKTGDCVIHAEEVWYRYEKQGADVIKGFSFSVEQGERICILGGNGTGKTTVLKLLAGLYRPYRGNIQKKGAVMLLPQNPQTVFVKSTVHDDLLEVFQQKENQSAWKLTDSDVQKRISEVAVLCQLEHLLERHPYDLSGGEQQRAALAKFLLLQPDILLLDEPTKGMDAAFKAVFAEILQQLKQKNVTVIMVSHDIEFCARYGERCMLFFDGTVIAEDYARAFFSGNYFYTTAASRIARDYLPDAVTTQDIIKAYSGTVSEYDKQNCLSEMSVDITKTEIVKKAEAETEMKTDRMNYRLLSGILILLMPLTVFCGTRYLSGNSHYAVALLLLLESMLFFLVRFEGKKPKARELVLISTICAVAVAGRAAFFMLPQCKPVLAITILAGAVLGAETGFLTGGQGVWTPWQMFGMGAAGFLAGILFRKEALPRTRLWLCFFGFFSAIFLYGVILNSSSALLYTSDLNIHAVAAYLISGFPMDFMHGIATGLFLWFLAEPVMEKLERIIKKYGIF